MKKTSQKKVKLFQGVRATVKGTWFQVYLFRRFQVIGVFLNRTLYIFLAVGAIFYSLYKNIKVLMLENA